MLFCLRSALICLTRLLDTHDLIPQSNSTPIVPARLKSKLLTLYRLMISDWDIRRNLEALRTSSSPASVLLTVYASLSVCITSFRPSVCTLTMSLWDTNTTESSFTAAICGKSLWDTSSIAQMIFSTCCVFDFVLIVTSGSVYRSPGGESAGGQCDPG